jgi:amidase
MSTFKEYRDYDAVGLASLMKKGEVSRTEVLETAIGLLEELNPKLNAVVHKEYDRARSATASAVGPLAGVPFLMKDTNDLQGAPTGWGSKLYQKLVAEMTDTLTKRHQGAGLVIFGKTNVPEFALVGTTEPLVTGPSRNPFDTNLTPGGSSGGSAAAVAARIVPAAGASDGGGSIRCPASACGVFGLKPTRARNPSGPVVGEGWQSLLQQHVVTRSVRDSAAILDATHGPELGDPYGLAAPARPFLEEVGRDPGSLKIALMTDYANGPPTDRICAVAAQDAAKLCESHGHKVEVAALPIAVEDMFRLLGTVCSVWVRSMLTRRGAQIGRKVTEADVEPMTWEMYNLADKITSTEYYDTIEAIHHTGRRVAAFFEKYDALITPGLAKLPVPLGNINTSLSLAEAGGALANFCPFTTTFNVTGQPAASIPLSWTSEGLPVGVQLVTRFGDEATLLRLASQLEKSAPWESRYARVRV